MPTLEQRLERARDLRKQGYNCSQCVYMVFDDVHGFDSEMSARISSALGGGVGGQHQVCGTVSAMSLVVGAAKYESPAQKAALYADVKKVCGAFSGLNGSIVCAELLADRPNRKPCLEYILDSITILDSYLRGREER